MNAQESPIISAYAKLGMLQVEIELLWKELYAIRNELKESSVKYRYMDRLTQDIQYGETMKHDADKDPLPDPLRDILLIERAVQLKEYINEAQDELRGAQQRALEVGVQDQCEGYFRTRDKSDTFNVNQVQVDLTSGEAKLIPEEG